MGKIIVVLVLVAVTVGLVVRHRRTASLQVGGIYSIVHGKDGYGVVKLLVYEDGICHLRVYKQKYTDRPEAVNVESLSLGKAGDPDGFGIGHIPMRESSFLDWQPELLTKTAVTPDELEGYKIWKENGGGVF